MTRHPAGVRRDRRVDFWSSVLFGAVYAGALFFVVTGFGVGSDGCGGRFRSSSCSAETYGRLGVGFGLILLLAPALHRVVPSVPPERGVGRAAGIAALAAGAAAGVALSAVAARALF